MSERDSGGRQGFVGVATAGLSLALVLGACSSSKSGSASTSVPKATTTTTAALPSAANLAATRSFLQGKGARLLEFERASAPLATGSAIDPAACRQLATGTLTKIGGPKTLTDLANEIADKPLGAAFAADILAKNSLIAACKSVNQAPASFGARTKSAADAVAQRLSALGIPANG